LSEVDLLILAYIGISATVSFFRGMFREAFSLAVWLCAILITLFYSSRFAALLPIDSVLSPVARASISGVTLFMGTLFVGGIMKWFLARILASSGLGLVDRIGGVAFGALRGVTIVALLLLAADLAPELKREQWWQNSSLIPHFQQLVGFIHARLPDTLGQHFDIQQPGY